MGNAVIILRYLFESILQWTPEDIRKNYSQQLFTEYKLKGMFTHVFNDSTPLTRTIKASILSKPVTLKGYLNVVTKAVNRPPDKIMRDFRLAHRLELIAIYHEPERGLCIREGAKMADLD